MPRLRRRAKVATAECLPFEMLDEFAQFGIESPLSVDDLDEGVETWGQPPTLRQWLASEAGAAWLADWIADSPGTRPSSWWLARRGHRWGVLAEDRRAGRTEFDALRELGELTPEERRQFGR